MKLLLPLLALALLAPSPSAQDADYTRFAKEFTKAMEYGDEPGMDKVTS